MGSRVSRAALVVTAIAFTGCTDAGGTLADGFEGGFTVAGGCRDMVVYASNADDSVALVFEEPGLVQDAIDTGGAPTRLELAASDVQRMVAISGSTLTGGLCSDEITDAEIVETYSAIGGTVILDLRPNLNVDDLPRVDVRFLDVAVQDDVSRELLIVADFQLLDIAVGWEP